MHTITALDALTGQQIAAMACACADREEPIADCNPFHIDADKREIFTRAYLARQFETLGFHIIQIDDLTPAQIKRRAAYAALVKSLAPAVSSRFCTPINLGPLNVKRATGASRTI